MGNVEKLVAVLQGEMLARLETVRGDLHVGLRAVRNGEKSRDATASVLNRLLEGIWALWVYPEWEPLRGRAAAPTAEETDTVALELLDAWDRFGNELIELGGPRPYYLTSAGVRAATLRRAGLGQPPSAITEVERVAIQRCLAESSPASEILAPAVWHASALRIDLTAAAGKIDEVTTPSSSDSDFKPFFSWLLLTALRTTPEAATQARWRQNTRDCVRQHYLSLAGTGVEPLALSFAAAFVSVVGAASGLVPAEDPRAVRRTLAPLSL